MKKKLLFLFVCFVIENGYSQVGVSTSHPKALFHVDGGKDNPNDDSEVVSSQAQSNDFVVNSHGQVGIGTIAPLASVSLDINVPRGLRISQMSQERRDSLTTIIEGSTLENRQKGEGLIIYNITSDSIEFYNGYKWVSFLK